MKAIGKYLVVSPQHEEIESTSGMILSSKDTDELRYQLASVVAPGELVNSIAKGDNIYFDKHQGHDIRLEGELYKVILERDIVLCL
tara:strand:- start:7922 stop:8179 length:258 start_codon:yes stop_codon:yes gene_type:complete